MATSRAADPAREVAMIALSGSSGQYVDTLREVIDYAFDQLCWRMTTSDLVDLLGSLNAKLAEENA